MGGPIDQSVSPGIEGFVVTFLIAAALWLLMRNMSTRLRNLRYREEEQEERRRTQGVQTRPSAMGARPGEGDASGDDTSTSTPHGSMTCWTGSGAPQPPGDGTGSAAAGSREATIGEIGPDGGPKA